MQRQKWNRSIRTVRLTLLRALPKNKLNARARRYIEQEERALPHVALRSPTGGFAPPVDSIMSADAIRRASDEDAVNAFRTLPDETGWSHPTRFATGGNVELAREFAQAARSDPERADRLLKKLDAGNGTRAAAYELDAMAEAADAHMVIAVLHDAVARQFDGEEFRCCASRAVEKLIRRQVPIDDGTAAIFTQWLAEPLFEDASDDREERDRGGASAVDGSEEQQDVAARSILWGHGDRFEPAVGDFEVLEATIRIHLARNDFDQLHDTLCAYLDRCRDPRAWSRVLDIVHFPNSARTACEIAFLERVFREVPRLVGCRSAAILLVNSHRWSEEFADSLLDRWRDAQSPPARQGYGEIVACTALLQPGAAWALARLDVLIENPALEEASAGAALSAAHRWTDSDARAGAWNILERLLPGGEPGVLQAVTEIFAIAREWSADRPTESLLTALADRPYLPTGHNANLIPEQLASLMDDYPVLVARVANRLVTAWRKELADIRTSTAMAAQSLVDLSVNLHRLGGETREMGIELFEELLEIDAFEARQTRDEIDNRFRDQGSIQRPSLRRTRRTTRRESSPSDWSALLSVRRSSGGQSAGAEWPRNHYKNDRTRGLPQCRGGADRLHGDRPQGRRRLAALRHLRRGAWRLWRLALDRTRPSPARRGLFRRRDGLAQRSRRPGAGAARCAAAGPHAADGALVSDRTRVETCGCRTPFGCDPTCLA